MKQNEAGVFLVRDSTTIAGDYVLCVRYGNFRLMFVQSVNGLWRSFVPSMIIHPSVVIININVSIVFYRCSLSQFVLCSCSSTNLIQLLFSICREDSKVSHYIINKAVQNGQTVFKIGDQYFSDLPELLTFYKLHYLDTTPLRWPLPRELEVMVGKFDFDGSVCINHRCYHLS